jgi:hypothetical protein
MFSKAVPLGARLDDVYNFSTAKSVASDMKLKNVTTEHKYLALCNMMFN